MLTERTAFRPDDVATAHGLLGQHTPYTDTKGVQRCCSASHPNSKKGPPWPCYRARWAKRAVTADDAGLVDYSGVAVQS